ncbi:MAG: riboflavin synthase [Chthoniobacteraceae bacterium]
MPTLTNRQPCRISASLRFSAHPKFLFSSTPEDVLMVAPMFTGIIEETGEVISFSSSGSGARLILKAPLVSSDLKIGDSIAVNGCCLTATSLNNDTLSFDLLNETLLRTNLQSATPSSLVNLERALAANARLGGHFVQGHIDCTSPVLSLEKTGADFRLEIALPGPYARYVVPKGSIAINGISLTVAELKKDSMVLWIIPHTMAVTNLRSIKAGDLVNLEFDMLAKYVERLLAK